MIHCDFVKIVNKAGVRKVSLVGFDYEKDLKSGWVNGLFIKLGACTEIQDEFFVFNFL